MLSKLIASHLTGQYDFRLALFTLPISLVELLLASTSLSLPPHLPPGVPDPGQGNAWVCVEAGKQKGTGMSFPGGRADFFEAKLEIPYLVHPNCSQLVMLKHTLFFSTHMHAISSQHITGLSSQQAIFVDTKSLFSADGALIIDESKGGPEPPAKSAWTKADQVKALVESYWVGHKTPADSASRFSFRDVDGEPARGPDALLKLHLPSFFRDASKDVAKSLDDLLANDERVRELVVKPSIQGGTSADQHERQRDWIQVRVATWRLSCTHTSQLVPFKDLQ